MLISMMVGQREDFDEFLKFYDGHLNDRGLMSWQQVGRSCSGTSSCCASPAFKRSACLRPAPCQVRCLRASAVSGACAAQLLVRDKLPY